MRHKIKSVMISYNFFFFSSFSFNTRVTLALPRSETPGFKSYFAYHKSVVAN